MIMKLVCLSISSVYIPSAMFLITLRDMIFVWYGICMVLQGQLHPICTDQQLLQSGLYWSCYCRGHELGRLLLITRGDDPILTLPYLGLPFESCIETEIL